MHWKVRCQLHFVCSYALLITQRYKHARNFSAWILLLQKMQAKSQKEAIMHIPISSYILQTKWNSYFFVLWSLFFSNIPCTCFDCFPSPSGTNNDVGGRWLLWIIGCTTDNWLLLFEYGVPFVSNYAFWWVFLWKLTWFI